MLPVTLTDIKHVPVVNAKGGLITGTRVTIMVGSYGPFQKDFYPPNDGPDYINQWKQQQQLAVQSIGGQ